MKKYELRIDRKKCIGAGYCASVAPKYWRLDSKNKATIRGQASMDIAKSAVDYNMKAAQICPTHAIDILNERGKSITGISTRRLRVKNVFAKKSKWVMDTKGYFTIKPFPKEGIIKVRYYNRRHELVMLITGKNAEDIYSTITRKNLVSLKIHAAYLGSELQKAELAMKNNLDYVQDDPLRLPS